MAWLAFVAPMFAGRVHYPSDFNNVYFAAPGTTPTVTSNLVDTDAFNALYPWHTYLGAQLRSGHLPLWDPTRFLGAPYAADTSMATFYPPNWLYALGHIAAVTTLIWAATMAASLLLAYWLLRILDLHPVAAALGAIVWTCSGFMISFGMSDPVIGSAVWLPMALAGYELARRGQARRGVPVAGAALALSVLAGHAQIALYVWMVVGLWAGVATAAAAWGRRTQGFTAIRREVARGMGIAAGAFAIGGGLAAIQVLGALEYAGQIVRQPYPYATVASHAMHPRNLATMLIPDYLGSALRGNYLGPVGLFIEGTIYAGILTLPLAAAGVVHRHRRVSAAFGLLVVIGAGAAFGTPLLRLLFVVPLVARTSQGVQRFKLLADAGLAGLAALGLDAVLRGNRAAARVVTITGALALITLGLLAAGRFGTTLPAGFIAARGLRAGVILAAGLVLVAIMTRQATRQAARPVAGPRRLLAAGMLVLLAGGDLWLFGFGYNVFQPQQANYPALAEVHYLSSVAGVRPRMAQAGAFLLPVNAAMVYGLYSLDGYDAFIPQHAVRLLNLVQGNVATSAAGNTIPVLAPGTAPSPILDLLGVRSVTTPVAAPAPGVLSFTGPARPLGGAMAIYTQPGAFPPAFLATCWAVRSDDQALAALAGMDAASLRTRVLLAPDAGAHPPGAPSGPCTPGPDVVVQRYTPEAVTLSVPASSPGGIVVLTDEWYPGWTARVDGKAAQIERADVALRGVAVTPGAHSVVLRFRPRWPLEGAATALCTLVAVAVFIALPRPAAPTAAGSSEPVSSEGPGAVPS